MGRPELMHFCLGMMTLFFSITGGVNWYDVYVPLRDVSQLAIGLMNLYIVIGFFTILNVVTGVRPGEEIFGAFSRQTD